jgi:alginate O-acetyltransferase complex protein AlgI
VLFPTATFAIFFVIVLPLSWLLMPRGERWRPFIIAASYVFYSAWDWRFVFLLAASTVWNQAFAQFIHRRGDVRARKWLLAGAIAGNVALLGYFKYYDFFVTSTNNLFALAGVDVPVEARSIILPVGISFFTFMGISYVVDVYRGDFEPTGWGKFAAYLSFFPHLVAGPIVRPGELIPQLDSPRDPRYLDTSRAFFLIGTGLFMKVVIANYLAANIVDDVFGAPNQHSSLEMLVGIYAYAVQIYADFFGYTNIAIGIALLLGFRFPQNFDAPYAATSIQDFWRRWHMTLSRWLRDYVYIPLGGNRGSRLFTYRNLMLTMLIGGLWHGAGWTFVAWGAIHGTALVAERWWSARPGRVERPSTAWRRAAQRLVTLQVVCFAWIFFRADSFADAWDVIVRLFTAWGEPSPLVTGGVLAAIAVGIGSQYLPRRLPLVVMARFSRLPVPAQAAVLSVALLVTHAMGPEGVAPFIYFQF